jgi:CBS domain containing-hemolysin-like protein
VFLFYALCDLLPKMLFRLYPNRLCLALARPFRFAHLGLRPLVQLVEWCSGTILRWTGGKVFTAHLFGNREELRLVMQESAQAFSSEERAMINRVLDLQALKVGQLATPLGQAVTVEAGTPLGDALALCRERTLTRLPVWESREGRRRITGLLNLDALIYRADLDPKRVVADYLNPAIYLEEDLRLEVALQRLQRSGQRLAVVLARDGREAGIVTLQDMLKIIFGEVSL